MTKIVERINVLDKGWIELQDIMGDDLSIVNAARTSYLGESKGDEQDKKLLFYLMKNGHTTPFEMVEFKFRVHCPIMVARQWMRHRTWSYNEQSLRYTEAESNEVYVPNEWRLQNSENKQGSGGTANEYDQELMTGMYEAFTIGAYQRYNLALERGIAREQARLFLPGFAVYTTFVAKVDAHNLMHFLKLRMHEHAQYEIRVYAQAIYEHFFKLQLPWTAQAFEEYMLHD